MKYIKAVLNKIAGWFQSPKVKVVLTQVETLISIALPLVEAVAVLTPNRTDDEIVAAYKKFGIPLLAGVQTGNAASVGNALLNLSTTLLDKKLNSEGMTAATNILNSAAQLAYTIYKAE